MPRRRRLSGNFSCHLGATLLLIRVRESHDRAIAQRITGRLTADGISPPRCQTSSRALSSYSSGPSSVATLQRSCGTSGASSFTPTAVRAALTNAACGSGSPKFVLCPEGIPAVEQPEHTPIRARCRVPSSWTFSGGPVRAIPPTPIPTPLPTASQHLPRRPRGTNVPSHKRHQLRTRPRITLNGSNPRRMPRQALQLTTHPQHPKPVSQATCRTFLRPDHTHRRHTRHPQRRPHDVLRPAPRIRTTCRNASGAAE